MAFSFIVARVRQRRFTSETLGQIAYMHFTVHKLLIEAGVPAGSGAGSSRDGHRGAGSRLQQSEEEYRGKEREREGKGPHSADQMTSLLQLMFSGAQTQG